MCGGQQTRFKAQFPKQLCSIFGTPLLSYTAEQVKQRGYRMYVQAHSPILLSYCVQHDMPIIDIEPHERLAGAIKATKPWWEERTIFLLGDVFFSGAAMMKIFNDSHNVQFFGSHYELYALSVRENYYGELLNRLTLADEHSRGKLWHVFRSVMGLKLPYEQHVIESFTKSPAYTAILDITDDMDTVEQYEALIRKLSGKQK
jgi:hypothetical protein